MRKFSFSPDPEMAWIYEPKYRADPVAKDLRARRDHAMLSVPQWMRDAAHFDAEES